MPAPSILLTDRRSDRLPDRGHGRALRDAATACAGHLDALARSGGPAGLRGSLLDCLALCELADNMAQRGSLLAEPVRDACALALLDVLGKAPGTGPRGEAAVEACTAALRSLRAGGPAPARDGDEAMVELLG